MSSAYQKALEAGYTEEEIQSHLAKKNPKYQKAIDAGYSPEEISQFLSGKDTSVLQRASDVSEDLNRQFLRAGARGAETVVGAPRAFGEFLEQLVPEKALKAGAAQIGLEKPVEKGLEFAKKYSPYKLLPEQEQVREFTKKLFKGKLEPKTESERRADELVSDFTALSLPLPGSKLRVVKPALLALGGQSAKEVGKQLGATESQQDWLRLGTMVLGALVNPNAAETLKDELYSKARMAKPEDARVSSQKLSKNIRDFQEELLKGDPDASSKKKALSLIKNIRKKVSGDEIQVEELEEFKRNINEARSSLYEEFGTDKVGMKSAKRNLDKIANLVDKSLLEYGKQNPEWEAFYRPANEVHGAIAQSQKARKVIGRVAKKYGKHAVLPSLGIGHYAGPMGLAGIAGGAATGAALVGAGELAVKFTKSPTLRKHYMNLMNSALKNDVVAVKNNLDKIEKEVQED